MGVKRWGWGHHGMDARPTGGFVKFEDHIKELARVAAQQSPPEPSAAAGYRAALERVVAARSGSRQKLAAVLAAAISEAETLLKGSP